MSRYIWPLRRAASYDTGSCCNSMLAVVWDLRSAIRSGMLLNKVRFSFFKTLITISPPLHASRSRGSRSPPGVAPGRGRTRGSDHGQGRGDDADTRGREEFYRGVRTPAIDSVRPGAGRSGYAPLTKLTPLLFPRPQLAGFKARAEGGKKSRVYSQGCTLKALSRSALKPPSI